TDKSLEETLQVLEITPTKDIKVLEITPTKDIKVETQNWGDTFVHDMTFNKTFDDSNLTVLPNE
ncbi:hypothetical protein BSK33_16335, partial [Geobacillus sp. 44B]